MSFRFRMDEGKVKIRLNIAGETVIYHAPYSQQEATRRTEARVNTLFDTWRTRFPEKSDRELLAMMAFRYADFYFALEREKEEAMREAEKIGTRLESILAEGPGEE